MRRTPLVRLLTLSLALAGCSSAMSKAMTNFAEARYPEAEAGFVRAQPEFAGWGVRRRAHYALYRGLTHLALGNAQAANFWLGYAKALLEKHPKVFDATDVGRLRAAWRSMGHMPGDDSVRLATRAGAG